MAVLERSELEASPLADLHAIAGQIGLDGFRRLRKADLIGAILERTGGDPDAPSAASEDSDRSSSPRSTSTRSRRSSRSRRSKDTDTDDEPAAEEKSGAEDSDEDGSDDEKPAARGRGSARAAGSARRAERGSGRSPRGSSAESGTSSARASSRASGSRERGSREAEEDKPAKERIAEGVVDLLGNGSAFLRVSPPEPSDEDVYISAAQVRRCELVSGDRVSGPVRTPRRSERYPSLARIDTINGASADSVSEGTRFDDLPVSHPSERLELDPNDPTLKAIEWLTPLGRGSRALVVGASRSGKTETLRRIALALAAREGLELTLVLAGVRPEEIADWAEGPLTASATLSFAASSDTQGQAVEHAVETARRVAARGGDAVVLIDSLDGLHPQAARKALAAARNLAGDGSLTVIATASRPFGGESTVIALDVALTSTGRLPALDLVNSGTIKPDLLVGEDEAKAIEQARAAALQG